MLRPSTSPDAKLAEIDRDLRYTKAHIDATRKRIEDTMAELFTELMVKEAEAVEKIDGLLAIRASAKAALAVLVPMDDALPSSRTVPPAVP